jgi:serine O-acetyltransferase
MIKRIAVLEHILVKDNKKVLEDDLELEQIYESFISAMKN